MTSQAYAISRALDEAHLLAHIARIGRMDAHARILDLLMELHERLELADLAIGPGCLEVPLTQEQLADAVGLTPVHTNRMLQQAKHAGELKWSGKTVTLINPAALSQLIGRASPRVQRCVAPEG